ncbi:PAS domain S-box protein [bacterium]|nr:MAG: PAS domain S-box protein [bacterium]
MIKRDSQALEFEGDPSLNETLSPRERQLLVMASNGLTDQGIAHELGISLATVSTYWGRVRIKFGALPRTELVAKFLRGEMARSNTALAASEAQMRTLLESSPLGIVLTDRQGGALYINSAYKKIAGADEEALREEGTLGLVHPDDRERVADMWRKCLHEGLAYTSEHRYLRLDGSVIWVRSQGDVWRQDGAIGGRVSMVEDVTAAHEAERGRIEAEQRYRTLLSLAPEAILSVDEEIRILEFNPGAERIFGYAAEEVIGNPLAMLLPDGFRDSHEARVRGFGAGSVVSARPMASRSAVHGLRKNGEEFPCEASIIRQTVNGKPLFTAILRDISDRVAAPR